MFPLTDLSLLFTVLLIIAFVFLGIFLLIGLFIYRKVCRNNHSIPPAPTISAQPQTNPTNILQSNIALSDWITFLSSEKYGVMGNVFSFGSLLMAAIGIILVTRTTNWIQIVGIVFFGLWILYILYFGTVSRFQKRGKLAGELLDKIMKGELSSEENVRNEWINQLNHILGRNHHPEN